MRSRWRSGRAPAAGVTSVPFAASAAFLAAALVLTPFWATYFGPFPVLTVGRVVVLLAGSLLLVEALRYRALLRRPEWPTVLLSAALVGLLAWIWVNAHAWGCFCAGGFPGLAELASVALISAAVGTLTPQFRLLLLAAAGVGAVLAALLAVVGFDDLHSALTDSTPDPGRLSGVYGNSNYLAYAIAFAVPLLVVAVRRTTGRSRWVALAALAGVGGAIALTLSRGGTVAAVAGGLVALALTTRGRLRAVSVLVVGLAAFGGAAALVYPYYNERRLEAEFGREIDALSSVDRSGWNGTPQGLIANGNAKLANAESGRVLSVTSTGLNQGVSYPFGAARQGIGYRLSLTARSAEKRLPLSIGLQDNLRGNGPVTASVVLTQAWRRFSLAWIPSRDSSSARLYLWQNSGPSTFFIRDLSISSGPRELAIETRLEGSLAEAGGARRYEREEASFVQARLDGIELAARAFREHPLRGVGWETFPEYAAARKPELGSVPTHNEYMRFASELGTPGIVFLILLAVAIAAASRRQGPGLFRASAAGVLAAGGVGLLFVNGLVVPSASVPLGVATGLLCASRRGVVGSPATVGDAVLPHVEAALDVLRGARAGVLARMALGRDLHSCRRCGALENLTVFTREGQPASRSADLSTLVTLCASCHGIVAEARSQAQITTVARRRLSLRERVGEATLRQVAAFQAVWSATGDRLREVRTFAPAPKELALGEMRGASITQRRLRLRERLSTVKGIVSVQRALAVAAPDPYPVAGPPAAPAVERWFARLNAFKARHVSARAETGLLAVGVGALSLAVRIPLLSGSYWPTPDSGEYLAYAAGLRGQGPALGDYRTPGYPLFVALADLLGASPERSVIVAQHLLGVLVAVAVVLVCRRFYGTLTALLAGSLTALSPAMAFSEHFVLPNFLFGVIVFFGALVLMNAVERGTLRALLLAGAVLGLAAYVKPVGQFLVLAGLLPLALSTRSLRKTLAGSAAVAAGLVLVIAPWIVRNAVQFGSATLSTQGGQTLFNRAFERDRLPIPTDSPEGRLARRVADGLPEGHRLNIDVLEAFIARGMTSQEALRAEGRLASQAIRANPGRFAIETWRNFRQMLRDPHDAEDRLRSQLSEAVGGRNRAFLARTWSAVSELTAIWWLLSVQTAASLLLLVFGTRRSRLLAGCFISVGVAVILGTVVGHGGNLLYALQLLPLQWVLGSAALVTWTSLAFRLGKGLPLAPSGRAPSRLERLSHRRLVKRAGAVFRRVRRSKEEDR